MSSSGSMGTLKRPASPTSNSTSMDTSMNSSMSSDTTNNKRQKTGAGGSNRESRASSPSAAAAAAVAPPSPLEQELITLVRTGSVKSISEVIAKFKRRLTDQPALKAEMTTAFKRVLTGGTKGEGLRIKEGF